MKDADKLVLTEINKEYDGDTYFPEFSESQWQEKNRDKYENFSFVTYTRK